MRVSLPVSTAMATNGRMTSNHAPWFFVELKGKVTDFVEKPMCMVAYTFDTGSTKSLFVIIP